MADPYRYFRVEAREIVDGLTEGVNRLESGGESELVARLLRQAHTLKGAARVVRLGPIADLAHEVEDLLADHRSRSGPVPRATVDALLARIDAVAAALAALDAPPVPAPLPRAPAEPEPPAPRADKADVDLIASGLIEALVEIGALRDAASQASRARQLAHDVAALLAPGRPQSLESARRAVRELGQLVAAVDQQLGASVARVEREVTQVQAAAERLGRVPLGSLLGPLERVTRESARALGRRASLSVVGGAVRVDLEVASALQRALVQLIRNAVAHGLEPEEERLAAGKAPAGRVAVVVEVRGGRVAVTCADDGRGIDLGAVRRALRDRRPGGPELDDEQVLALLLSGGVSTSGVVTELAGRGVGLDLVRDAVTALGGRVSIRTTAGAGTSVRLDLPVTSTAIEALIASAGGVDVVVPLAAVRGVSRADASGGVLLTADEGLPCASLAALLGVRSGGRAVAAVLLEHDGVRAALLVERLRGIEVAVVQGLPEPVRAAAFVVGGSLDPAGDPRLVLDPAAVIAACRGRPSEPPVRAPRLPILVVDDSLTTRMLEQSILAAAGYDVEVAASGEEAFVRLRERRYGLMLVDIEMPGMDGFAVIRALRADPALRDLPAIVVSSRESAADRRRGEEVGASGWIVKSQFHQGRLLAEIEGLLP